MATLFMLRRMRCASRMPRPGKGSCMDPTLTEAQAEALAATRRILAVIGLKAFGGDEAAFTQQDRQLLAAYDSGLLGEDLRVFAEWHEDLGTDPDDALAEMRRRFQQQPPPVRSRPTHHGPTRRNLGRLRSPDRGFKMAETWVMRLELQVK